MTSYVSSLTFNYDLRMIRDMLARLVSLQLEVYRREMFICRILFLARSRSTAFVRAELEIPSKTADEMGLSLFLWGREMIACNIRSYLSLTNRRSC